MPQNLAGNEYELTRNSNQLQHTAAAAPPPPPPTHLFLFKEGVVVDAEGGYLVMIHWVMVSQVAEELMRVIFKLLQSQGIEKTENPVKLATIQTWYRVKSCSFRVPSRTATTLHDDPEKNDQLARLYGSEKQKPNTPRRRSMKALLVRYYGSGPIGIRGLRKLKTLINCRVFGLIRPNSSYPRGSSLISGGIWCMDTLQLAGSNWFSTFGCAEVAADQQLEIRNHGGQGSHTL